MRVLVEILHPAHVHVFRNAIRTWRDRGDDVLVLSREKECATQLLDAYGIPHICISRLAGRKAGLIGEMFVRDLRMLRAARSFRPDVLVGIMGVTIAQIGKMIRKPAVVFYDTENATLTNRVVYPLAHAVCTPDCYKGEVHGHHVTYPGYHELAYLHPNRFTPDPEVVRSLGIDPDSFFSVLRFVSWQASHDIGERGLQTDFIRQLVQRLEPRGRVIVSSEAPLPDAFEPYRAAFPPEAIHHVIAHAGMLVGESATMASEAAVLGVPAVYVSDTGRGYTDELEERYGLVRNFKTTQRDAVLSSVDELLATPDLRDVFQERRRRMLGEKIDVTDWIVRYIDTVVA